VARPAILALEPDESDRARLVRELAGRYGDDYDVEVHTSTDVMVERLDALQASPAGVALVLAPNTDEGSALLRATRPLHAHATRVLLLGWNENRAEREQIIRTLNTGDADYYVVRPLAAGDERFHRTVTELLDEWWRLRGRPFATIVIVGEEHTRRAHEMRDLLHRHDLPYVFLPVESDDGREVLAAAGIPLDPDSVVVVVHGADPMLDPTNVEVAHAIGARTRPRSGIHDVAVIGGGPAGLAAAVTAGSEGLRTALVERTSMGGQAGTSSLIRNYLGFPRGISGAELASRALEQAILFGAEMVYGGDAVALAPGPDDLIAVTFADGDVLHTRTVVLATGVAYRRLDLPAIEALVGLGVYYGAAMSEAATLAGEHVVVVGGGNSAGQAAMHLARFAAQVTMLVRSDSLAASMSEYLITSIDRAPNIDVRHHAAVVDGGGTSHLAWIDVEDARSGAVERIATRGLFVLIGADPCTDWLPDVVERDDWGYIVTRATPDERGFSTSMPGVFAVGDVRRGAVKRVASATGEGSVSIRYVHDHLGDLTSAPTEAPGSQ
jgi:thioredoxin reductase (NADPH)